MKGKQLPAIAGLAATITAGILATTASPALAEGNKSCDFGLNNYVCETGTVTPNASHQITISSIKKFGKGNVTCRAYDYFSGHEVGQVASSSIGNRTSKTIGGLYGHYYLVCVGPGNTTGGGSISG